MEITDVRVVPVDEPTVKAYASIVIDDCFVVKDLKVIDSEAKVFVAMPSKRMKDGTHRDMVHPLNRETRRRIEETVLEAYRRARLRSGL
jgi:stage V sporulation protein G